MAESTEQSRVTGVVPLVPMLALNYGSSMELATSSKYLATNSKELTSSSKAMAHPIRSPCPIPTALQPLTCWFVALRFADTRVRKISGQFIPAEQHERDSPPVAHTSLAPSARQTCHSRMAWCAARPPAVHVDHQCDEVS